MLAIKHRVARSALLLMTLGALVAGAAWACGGGEKEESPQAAAQAEKTAQPKATAPSAAATANPSRGALLALGPSPTAEEVMLCALEAAQGVKTWQGDMTMTMDMSLPMEATPGGSVQQTGMKMDAG